MTGRSTTSTLRAVDERLATNQARWDERVAAQLGSPFAPIDAFRAGRPVIEPFEVDELGPLDGMAVLHLQCHLGLDTLDLARLHPTARLTGLDFSATAIDAARRLAREVRLADRAEFVCAEVTHAVEALAGRRFDLVYTGKGALTWLPDLDRWAAEVHQLLAPGGFLYLAELHPATSVLAADRPEPARDYFSTEPIPVDDDPLGSSAGPAGGYQWTHPVAQVVTALVRAGLVVELLHEWDESPIRVRPYLVRGADGRFRWPGPGTLPLMYSIKGRRPLR